MPGRFPRSRASPRAPPMDMPTTWAVRQRRWSISPSVSPAIASVLYSSGAAGLWLPPTPLRGGVAGCHSVCAQVSVEVAPRRAGGSSAPRENGTMAGRLLPSQFAAKPALGCHLPCACPTFCQLLDVQ